MTNSILEFMGKDHDRLDELFKEFRQVVYSDKNKAKNLFHDFKTGLQRHIIWEEDLLFPVFDDKTGMHDTGPTAVMRTEHKHIKGFLEEINDELVNGAAAGIENTAKELVAVLTNHNNKEESILYQWIDESLDDKERKELFILMNKLPVERYDECCV